MSLATLVFALFTGLGFQVDDCVELPNAFLSSQGQCVALPTPPPPSAPANTDDCKSHKLNADELAALRRMSISNGF